MSDKWKIERCFVCGVSFAITTQCHEVFVQTRQTFYCPHGHGQRYIKGPTEAEKLRTERDQLKQQAAYLEDRARAAEAEASQAKRTAAAYKGVTTRERNRVKNGVCPCCNRTFSNLAAHMAGKHPEFGTGDDIERGAAVRANRRPGAP